MSVTKQALGLRIAGQEAIFEIVITKYRQRSAIDRLHRQRQRPRSHRSAGRADCGHEHCRPARFYLCSDGGVCQIDQLVAQDTSPCWRRQGRRYREHRGAPASVWPRTMRAVYVCASVSAEIERVTDVAIRKDDLATIWWRAASRCSTSSPFGTKTARPPPTM
ncbi:MAG: hypothetical protein R2856_06820 [Caldilineaceae bacterium]